MLSFFCACVGIVIFYDKPAQILESAQDACITHIMVEKAKRTLSLYAGDEVIKTYAIALGKILSDISSLKVIVKHLKENMWLIQESQIALFSESRHQLS